MLAVRLAQPTVKAAGLEDGPAGMFLNSAFLSLDLTFGNKGLRLRTKTKHYNHTLITWGLRSSSFSLSSAVGAYNTASCRKYYALDIFLIVSIVMNKLTHSKELNI